MAGKVDFNGAFNGLKAILKPYEPRLTVEQDSPVGYTLNGPYSEKWKKVLFFGGVQINKNYVSFHLMPVYMFPELLQELSPGLKARMQGKSCFNFKAPDETLFAELEALTRRSVERLRESGLVQSPAPPAS